MPFYTSNFTPMDETAQRNAEWQRQWLAMVLGQQGDGGGGGGGMPGGGMLQQILGMAGINPSPTPTPHQGIFDNPKMPWYVAPGTYNPWTGEGQWQSGRDAAHTPDQFIPPWGFGPPPMAGW